MKTTKNEMQMHLNNESDETGRSEGSLKPSYDMVVYSHLRWEFVFQRPQQIMSRMSESYKILFVEEPIGYSAEEEFTGNIREINPNLTIFQPRCKSIQEIGEVVGQYLSFSPVPLAWFYSAAFCPVLETLQFNKIVYDCMDELSLFRGASPELVALEEYLLSVADLVFTGGKSLYEAKKKLHSNIHCFPSSVDSSHFTKRTDARQSPEDVRNLPRPIIGYYGVVDERIDFELLQNVALLNPNASFVMVGPLAKVEQKDLPSQKNLHFLGMKTYQELPAYLEAFDMAMMPFALNEATRFISPTKTLEFMAASKFIISTAITDVVSDYGHCVEIVNSAEEFSKAMNVSPDAIEKKIAFYETILANTSWEATVKRMKEHLQVVLLLKKVDIVIIGAGISGCVLAERYASSGKKVLVIEKRDHIAGNCYDYVNEANILVSKYGAHLFHTNDEEVWEYLQCFSEWYPWEHKVLAKVDNNLVPIPVNITTVNTLFKLSISSKKEMKDWLEENTMDYPNPENGKQAALARVGHVLYEKMFRHYTKKQWGKYPEELDASVLNRIPVRVDYDDRYFSDKYQALPKKGYTHLFSNILNHPNIEVRLNTDYFDVKDEITGYDKLFYTGPIDRFFDFKFSLEQKLEYRSINFVSETLDMEQFQQNSVINYPGLEVDYTRIIEYKHFGNQVSDKTTIVREYTVDHGEPYYPVPNQVNQQLYERYKKESDKLTNVYFVGRLANYKYFNMDQAFKNALDLFEELQKEISLDTELIYHD